MANAANADLTYSVDSRLPVGDSLKPSDPTHPGNIIKKLLETGNQAVADSAYDNKPKRLPSGVKEGFQVVMTNPTQTKQIFLISAILGVILSLVFVTRENPLFIKIALVIVLVISTHYLIGRLENRTV